MNQSSIDRTEMAAGTGSVAGKLSGLLSRGLAVALAAAAVTAARAETLGLHWVGAGVAITDGGGAFGVPLAAWNNLIGASGSTTLSPPSGGAVTVTWTTGGGIWQSGTTFGGFSAGENQVFSGNLFAAQNDPAGAGAITITITGMNSIAQGDYQLRLMAAIDGPSAGRFREALFSGGPSLFFDTPAVSGGAIAATTTNHTLGGDSFTFAIANDNVDEGGFRRRAELSGLVLEFSAPPAPTITQPPPSQTVPDGMDATFTVTATGTEPLSYQWQFNGLDMSGETASTLTLLNATAANAGSYRVKVTDADGRFSLSPAATLIVAPAGTTLVYDPATITAAGAEGYGAGLALFFDVVAGTSVDVTHLGAVLLESALTNTVTVQLYSAATATVLAAVTFDGTDTPAPVASTPALNVFMKTLPGSVRLGPGSYAIASYHVGSAPRCPRTPVGTTLNTGGGAIQHRGSRYGNAGPGTMPNVPDGTGLQYLAATFQMTVSGAPVITQPPQSGTFILGNDATLSAEAGGSLPLTYQWQKEGADITGATGASLSLTNVGEGDTAGYTVVVGNSYGSVTSAVATVIVTGSPVITQQPQGGTFSLSSNVTLSVQAGGLPAPGYQWRKDDTDITGATAPSLTLANAGPYDAGNYTVVVANSAGSVTSLVATVVVRGSLVIDNSSPIGYSTVGAWTSQGYPNPWERYNQDWQYQDTAGAPDTATWSFSSVPPGRYCLAVSTAYNGQTNLTTDARYTVSDGGGTVSLNQALGPRDFDHHFGRTVKWGPGFARLSTFNGYIPMTITDGSLEVTVRNGGAAGFLTADAARLDTARFDTLKVWIIGDRETARGYSESAAWGDWGGEFEHNHDYRFSGDATATFAFSGLNPGRYRVSATWPAGANRPVQTEYAIPGVATNIVSQQVMPNDDFFEDVLWEDLFQNIEVTNGTLAVTLRSLGAGVAIADAMRLELIDAPPSIERQPQDTHASEGSSASFAALAIGTAPLSYQWYSGESAITNQTNATLTLGSVAPADLRGYYVVAVNPQGSATSQVAVLTPNLPPTAGDDGAATSQDQPVSLPVARLLQNDSDPDNDALSVVSVSPTSTNGGAVVLGLGVVTYTPQPGFTGLDRFTCTVADGHGGFAAAAVEVQVVSGVVPAQNSVSLTPISGGYRLRFLGVPGTLYEIQRSTDLVEWVTLTTDTAPPSGLLEYEDMSSPQPAAFYRTKTP
jgi:hypothetical protein